MKLRDGLDDIIYRAVTGDDGGVCRSLGRLSRFQPVPSASAEAFLDAIKRLRFDCVGLDI